MVFGDWYKFQTKFSREIEPNRPTTGSCEYIKSFGTKHLRRIGRTPQKSILSFYIQQKLLMLLVLLDLIADISFWSDVDLGWLKRRRLFSSLEQTRDLRFADNRLSLTPDIGDRLQRLSALNRPSKPLSTQRREPCIFM